MKYFTEINKYQQYIDLETGQCSCTCADYTFRQVHLEGKCKHIKLAITELKERLEQWLKS